MKNEKELAIMVVLIIVILLGVPDTANSYYERARYIQISTPNIYEFDFEKHWKQVSVTLNLNNNSINSATVEDLYIDYDKTGNIKRLDYSLKWKERKSFRYAYVSYNDELKKIRLYARKATEWTEWAPNDRMISSNTLFTKLNEISIQDMTTQEDFPYYSLVFRGRTNFSFNIEDTFIINDNEIVPFNEELPVDCYWIHTFGENGTGDYSSMQNYLFDLRY